MLTFLPIGEPLVPIARIDLDVLVVSFFHDSKTDALKLCVPIAFQAQTIAAISEKIDIAYDDIRSMAFDTALVEPYVVHDILAIGDRMPDCDRRLVAEMQRPGPVYVHCGGVIGTITIRPEGSDIVLVRKGRSAAFQAHEGIPRYMMLHMATLHMASDHFDPDTLLMSKSDVDAFIDYRLTRSLFSYEYFIPGAES